MDYRRAARRMLQLASDVGDDLAPPPCVDMEIPVMQAMMERETSGIAQARALGWIKASVLARGNGSIDISELDYIEKTSCLVFHVPGSEFVERSRLVLNALGEDGVYEDDLMVITANCNSLDLEIERKAILHDEGHLIVSNPVTMVMRGEVIRHHGEHCYLAGHLRELHDHACLVLEEADLSTNMETP